jgi:hypothetical protein
MSSFFVLHSVKKPPPPHTHTHAHYRVLWQELYTCIFIIKFKWIKSVFETVYIFYSSWGQRLFEPCHDKINIVDLQSDQDPCCSLSVSLLVIGFVSEQHGSWSDAVANALCWFCRGAAHLSACLLGFKTCQVVTHQSVGRVQYVIVSVCYIAELYWQFSIVFKSPTTACNDKKCSHVYSLLSLKELRVPLKPFIFSIAAWVGIFLQRLFFCLFIEIQDLSRSRAQASRSRASQILQNTLAALTEGSINYAYSICVGKCLVLSCWFFLLVLLYV